MNMNSNTHYIDADTDPQALIEKRNDLIERVRRHSGFTEDQFTEYIDEAEHQDGYSYWNNFNSALELHNDLCRYYDTKPQHMEDVPEAQTASEIVEPHGALVMDIENMVQDISWNEALRRTFISMGKNKPLWDRFIYEPDDESEEYLFWSDVFSSHLHQVVKEVLMDIAINTLWRDS